MCRLCTQEVLARCGNCDAGDGDVSAAAAELHVGQWATALLISTVGGQSYNAVVCGAGKCLRLTALSALEWTA